MEETGVVISIDGEYAKVSVQRKSACDKCTAGTCVLSGEGATIEGLNRANASVGQTVKVALMPYTYIKGSLIIYGIPAILLVIGAVLGKELAPAYFPASDPELVSAGFGFGLLGISIIFIRFWSKRAEKNMHYKPVIVEVLDENEINTTKGD